MLPYGIVFSLFSLNAFLNKKSTKTISLLVFIFFVFFYCLRNGIGIDWQAYELYFNNIKDKYIVSVYDFEKGFWLLSYVFSNVFGSYRILVVTVGLFVSILFWKASNVYTKNIGIVMLLSLFYLFYPTLEAFRQSITLALFYFSLQYVNKNSKKYLLLNIIGLLFHRTGVIAIAFYFFNRFKIIRVIAIPSLIFFYVLEPYISDLILSIPSFGMKYYYYFHLSPVDNALMSFKSLEYLLILVAYFVTKNKHTEIQKTCFNLVLLGFVLQVTLGQVADIVYRMIYFTDIAIILTYALFYDRFKTPLFKYIYIVSLIVYIVIRFYRVFPFDNPLFIYSI